MAWEVPGAAGASDCSLPWSLQVPPGNEQTGLAVVAVPLPVETVAAWVTSNGAANFGLMLRCDGGGVCRAVQVAVHLACGKRLHSYTSVAALLSTLLASHSLAAFAGICCIHQLHTHHTSSPGRALTGIDLLLAVSVPPVGKGPITCAPLHLQSACVCGQ